MNKLSREDRKLLTEWGVAEKDFQRIKDVGRYTTFTLFTKGNDEGKKVSAAKAIEVLGWKTYLSGIVRSSFHQTAERHNENGDSILFDSSRYFLPEDRREKLLQTGRPKPKKPTVKKWKAKDTKTPQKTNVSKSTESTKMPN